MVLNRNALTDEYIKEFYEVMQLDNYVRCIQLKYNCLSAAGIKNLQQFAIGHPQILSIDVRGNLGEHECGH